MKIQKNCPQPAIIPKEKYIPPEKQKQIIDIILIIIIINLQREWSTRIS